jgi:AsmA protein
MKEYAQMRALKLVGIVLGCLVALVVILLLAVRLFVDPNDYKGRIAQQVKSSTGRELTLAGPIKLSVFPWIALELGAASIGNPPGFAAEPFAAVQHVAVRVKLLPLLRKQLEIGRIEIDGLDLRLRKNSAGQGNWENFGGNTSKPEESTRSSSGTLPDLAGVEIKDSRLSYQNMVANHVNLELGHVTAGTPIPVKLKLDLTTGAGAKPIDINGQVAITLDPQKKQYRIAPLEIDGTMSPAKGAAAMAYKFSVPQLDVDLGTQTFSAPAFSVELASLHLGGSLAGTKIVDAPSFKGTFKLDPVSLRDLMAKFAITPPVTRDPKVLAKLAANGSFTYGGNALAADGLDIQLDDSQLRGKVAVTNLDTKATNFTLAIDRINLDRYRAPEETTPKTAEKPTQKTASKKEAPSSDPLKTLDLNGTLTIGSAIASNMNLTQLLVTIAAKNGVTHIAPARAKLYGGDYMGDITIDDREATPLLKIDQSMTGIDVSQLLKDFAKTQRMSGRGTVTTNLTAHSLGGDALLKTLNGHVSANIDNGAIEGLDLWFEINRAVALIQKQGVPSGQSTGRTKFDAFKVSADLNNGVASTKDLNIASQNLRVTGQGTANLVNNAINYQVKATVLKEAPTAGSVSAKTLADIPLNITGTLSSPTVRPDLEQLAKVRLQQEVDKHKDELQQKLMDKLKGVFH